MNREEVKEKSMTDDNAECWEILAPKYRIQRLTEWANMLEERMKELDPEYRAYPWGRHCK